MKTLVRRLAPCLALAAAAAVPSNGAKVRSQQNADVAQVLEKYRAGQETLSLELLDEVMDPELLVLEHGGKDVGWAAYRNEHLGHHFAEWKSFKISDLKVLASQTSGDWAYVAQESVDTIVAAKDGSTRVIAVTETLVLKRGPNGWKIRHLHVSLKKKS